MSDVSATQRIENFLITVDNYSDYIPVWSSMTNLVDIFEKGVGEWACGTEALKEHEYCKHIHDKPYWRCALLILPIIGNVIIAIYDFFKARHETRMQMLVENFEASQLDIGPLPTDPTERAIALQNGRDAAEAKALGIVGLLPEDPAQRRQMLDEAIANQLATIKAEYLQKIDEHIQTFPPMIQDFNEHIQHPEKPLQLVYNNSIGKVLQHTGHYPKTFDKSPLENLNYYWLSIRLIFSYDDVIFGLGDQGIKDDLEVINRKQQIEAHKTTLIQMRRTSYENLVGQLKRDLFLKEMKAQYLESFTSKDVLRPTEETVNAMKYFELLSAIKERISQIEDPYRKIELEVFAVLDLPES